MSMHGVNGRGKELQRIHGLDAIPPKCEYECAAGLWDLIKSGIEKAPPKNGL